MILPAADAWLQGLFQATADALRYVILTVLVASAQ
jgi:hypothetical protein